MTDTTSSVHSDGLLPLHAFFAPLGGVKQLCIDARLLHSHLKINIKFPQWFQTKMQKYGFQVDLDWQYISQKPGCSIKNQATELIGSPKENHIGRPFKNYLVSLEAAKALSLIENNSKSYQIWKSLIQQENCFASALESGRDVEFCENYLRITTAQAQKLKELVNECSRKTQQHHQTIWTQFQHRFMVRRYFELPAKNFEEACSYLSKLLELNITKGLPLENKNISLEREIQEKVLSVARDVITSVSDALQKNQKDQEKQKPVETAINC